MVFAPHTYSRTEALWNGFVSALRQADFTILLDIYPAREKPIDGITSKNLALSIGESAISASIESAYAAILSHSFPICILMGAGDMSELVGLIKSSEGFTA